MPMSLKKGAKFSLTKAEPRLERVHIGLGWDVRPGGGAAFDVDASVFLLGDGRKVRRDEDMVFYNNMRSSCGAVLHKGDNRTGAGGGDDEVLTVDLKRLPEPITTLAVCISIHDADARGQSFGQIDNAFIRLVDLATNREVARFDVGRQAPSDTALLFGELDRGPDGWSFRAAGEGMGGDLATLAELFGVEVA
jgi:tellurium resistance protein TerD